jgi:GntR family phosphonate transport system transcriptional regulator
MQARKPPETSDFSDPSDPGVVVRRWGQIVAEIRTGILAGRCAPGARLPNETQLAARFGLHRHTLRQAVQRRGTFVRELVLDDALQQRTRMSENLAQAGERARRDLPSHDGIAADDRAASLQLAHDAPVALLHTRATVRGRPIGLSHTAYPLPRFTGMAAAFQAAGSISGALRRLGRVDYFRASSSVSCRLPTAAEADALARPESEPVLVVQYPSVDGDGVPVKAGRKLFAADAVQLNVAHDR